jgi:DNA-binding CsgD family transcriptional regulator
MSAVESSLAGPLGQADIERVYRGQAALVDGQSVNDVLLTRQFETAQHASEGSSYKEIAAIMGVEPCTVRTHLNKSYGKLGISSKAGLAPYFPIDPDSTLLQGKKLMDLESVPFHLEILEALSTGLCYKQIAAKRRIKPSTARFYVGNIGKIWTDAKGALMSARVANGIRARYIPIIDAHPETFEQPNIGKLTLLALVELEPIILRDFLEA